MKIAQLRRVLETVANMHQKGGRAQDAEALRKLGAALKPADKLTVAAMVEKIKS